MEMKGFVATMESVLASSLLLSLTLIAVPQLASSNQLESRQTLQQATTALQSAENLAGDPSSVKASVSGFLPPGLKTRTTVSSYNQETRRLQLSSSSENITAPKAPFVEAQFFTESATSLEARFNGSTIAPISTGYQREQLPGFGNLTLDGTGRLTVIVSAYDQSRSSGNPEGTRFSASTFLTDNGTKEVVVEAWSG